MTAELKYYKYTDVNGNPNKTVGVRVTSRDPEGLIKEVKGSDGISKLLIIEEKFVNQDITFKPKNKDLIEISKDEYDTIAIPQENILDALNRIKYGNRITKIYNKFVNAAPLTMTDHLKRAAKSTGIAAATPEEAKILLPLANATPTITLAKAR